MRDKRIWELDALRGVAIIMMAMYHLLFDLTYYYGIGRNIAWLAPASSTIFMLLCGAMCELSRRNLKRGLFVLLCGMAITVITYIMDSGTYIRFGVLHLLGCCILLYEIGLRRLSSKWLVVVGTICFLLSLIFDRLDIKYLLPFGITYSGFVSLDYYPLVPYLGVFCLGIVLFRAIYKERRTRIDVPWLRAAATPLTFIGKHSLWIYLIHQPLFMGILYLIMLK